VTYLIEYFGEFKFIFETVLGNVSGDQMGSFEAKKTKSKISRLGTFKPKTLDRRLCTGRSGEAVVIYLFGLEALLTRESFLVLSPPPPNYRLLLANTVIKPSFHYLPQ
jgi:hypothetical protein